MAESVFLVLGSPWQDVKLAASHERCPVHFWCKPYKSRMREMDVELHRIADASACSITIASSKSKLSNAAVAVLAARTFQVVSYWGLL